MSIEARPVESAETLLKRAADLVPALKERARQAEEGRRIPEETVRDLRDAGLFNIATPSRFGGTGHEIDLMFQVAMELGRGCGSSAWCYSVLSIHNWMVGHWPLALQEEYFATGPDTLSSSSFAPIGRLTPVDGGYRLSGHWDFSSGADAGTWALLGAMGPQGPSFVMVPRPEYDVLDDTWHVSGMRGTGSKDVVIEDAFVPEYRLIPVSGLGTGSGMAEVHQRHSYRLPAMSFLPYTLCSPLAGIAQAAVENFIERLQGTTGAGRRTAESATIQARLAESSVEADTARLIVTHDTRELMARAMAGDVLSDLETLRYRRNVAYVSRLCVSAVDRLFEASGGRSLYDSDPMQRIHRDVHAGAHQTALFWDTVAEAYGRAAFGLPPLLPNLPGQTRRLDKGDEA
ncbi:MAG TPA: acyl-CoA dehydrogenase family protein [Dehalococcoidia bacterium]|jgi:3-hydroxy-9,10-secoandrosta-1,3,5(10)-triene-9,17-dione monooxygenase|nr:acyl-CoA dehydrogenase family protein [Dehalococcoidia bacterium]